MSAFRRFLLGIFLVAATLGLRAPFVQRAIWNVDEGITITAAERILDGGVLYRDIADQRSPMVPYLKAVILAVFGDWNTTAIQVVLAFLLGLGAVGVWQIARSLGHGRAGIAAAAVYTVLCFVLPHGYDALAAHTEWFLMLFSIAAFLLFAAVLRRPGFSGGAGVGVLFGCATLCKQPGMLDGAVALVLLGLLVGFRPTSQRASLVRMAGGIVIGFILVVGGAVGYFVAHGAGPDLLYFAWTYNNEVYVPAVPLASRLLTMREPFRLAADMAPAVLVLGLLGALVLPVTALRGLGRKPAEIRLLPWLALGWTAAGILATSLSGRAFSHYSIQVIPGLSLVCGWVLVAGWDWLAGRRRWWRLAAAALLVVASLDTGARLVRRFVELDPKDYGWTETMGVVRAHTNPAERVFFWGFAPDCYVHSRRLPATRFVYTTFLTGLIPWANIDPMIDTDAIVTPGSWDRLREDFAHTPPAMIIDTGSVRYQNKYRLHDQAWLWSYLTRGFAEVNAVGTGFRDFRFYRRVEPVAPKPLPSEAVPDPAVQVKVGYTCEANAMPRLLVSAPAGAMRAELYLDGTLFRSLALPDGHTPVAFFVPHGSLTDDSGEFVAVLQYADGLRASAPVALTREKIAWHARHAPGPAISFLDGEIRPVGSETSAGRPVLRDTDDAEWITPPTARLTYERPAGLRSFTFTFGLDEGCYYDRPDRRASDGTDFLVEYVDGAGVTSRLFSRRLYPKVSQADCGHQTAEVALPNTGPGRIVLRVLSGPKNNEENDFAYIRDLVATAYGPPARFLGRAVPAEQVSAHNDPVMTCDQEGRWTAHSPSSVSYECPTGARALVFDYGLESGSYDGSRDGRTDGIEVTVVGEGSGGVRVPLFRRLLAPASVGADRGRQSSRIDLGDPQVRRVSISIGPGPSGNDSFDWSYLADLRFE